MSDSPSGRSAAVIRPPNMLKSKTGTLPSLSNEALAEVDEAIVAWRQESAPDFGRSEIMRIRKSFDRLEADPKGAAWVVKPIYDMVHNLRGLSTNMDYPLATVIGNSLCRYLEQHPVLTPYALRTIKVHVESLSLILLFGMTGSGGQLGRELTGLLETRTDRALERDLLEKEAQDLEAAFDTL